MPERLATRFVALVGAALVALAGLAPAALGQEEDWAGSELTDPFDGGVARVSQEAFEISGVFVKTDRNRVIDERINDVTVTFEDLEATSSPDTTPTSVEPEPAPVEPCVPEPVVRSGAGTVQGDTTRYEFTVSAEESVWPCNGRFGVTATARTSTDSHQVEGVLEVAVPPPPVTEVSALADADAGTIEVSWHPLDGASQLVGYRIERAGPGDDAGFERLGDDLAADATPTIVDDPGAGGAYRYRVRALREAPGGPVASPVEGTGEAEASLPGGETTTTSTSIDGPNRPRVSGGRSAPVAPSRGGTPRLTTPTTADTGFDESLGYGDREPGGDSPELAGRSGQSIIRTDGDGAGLLAPVAGAMVLLGWAGHLVYLNRLAKQF